ncbi:YihY/virulence factor BrkB family protein [Acetobacterium sp. K1/6]|jgi:membrane protein|uniref:YihY/virulence factor BrkB family protein n=1 Tax=Acetobacterium sp. K1/6 TaxID=3055467 RepID=UPI0029E4097B|nr:YihY/virulence factor BrkB family protein [Acetobacterium sp. K1/6]MDK2961477.1 rane protein [Eubacteriaceae bacterium]MDZ5724121.1 YihY/virulence factor BrkB family protein [Acetobacterium sp. K1/6]
MKKDNLIKLLKDLYVRFSNDDLPSVGAQITYFLLLSIAPFLIFLITLISFIPLVDFQSQIEPLYALMPTAASEILNAIIEQTMKNRSGALLTFGVLFALWSASTGVKYLISGVNRAYDQEETRPFWKKSLVSLAITLELSMVIIVTMILIIFGGILGSEVFGFLGFSKTFSMIWNYLRFVIAIFAVMIAFVSIYFSAPSCRLTFKEVLPGAVVATFSWIIVSMAFSFYADNLGNYTAVYGSLGGVIALLTWIYISSIIFLLGAEINASLKFRREGIKKTVLKNF